MICMDGQTPDGLGDLLARGLRRDHMGRWFMGTFAILKMPLSMLWASAALFIGGCRSRY